MTAIATTGDVEPLHPDIIAQLLFNGDLGGMNDGQKMALYLHKCKGLGLDPGEHPFQLLKLKGKEVLYATKACMDALCRERKVSREIVSAETVGDLYVVRVRAKCGDRIDEDMGAVGIKGLSGEDLCNAMMKATTKAKRRAVLAMFGVGALDETEVDSIRGARVEQLPETIGVDDSHPRQPMPEDPRKRLNWELEEIAKLRRHCGYQERSARKELRALRGDKPWPSNKDAITEEMMTEAIGLAVASVMKLQEEVQDIADADALMPGRGGPEPEAEVMG